MRGLVPPFALKVVSPDIIHKSDAGGVALNLGDADAVRAAMAGMARRADGEGHRLEGFLIEQMAPPGHAIVIGGVRDPEFGPVIMLGLGDLRGNPARRRFSHLPDHAGRCARDDRRTARGPYPGRRARRARGT
ncbi:MAG: acetate--CoA ligase family protein [Betaproteobacteria bacterium]|nr:acetate--CoA ligase family protein [Betaproteobacteria bacterium]